MHFPPIETNTEGDCHEHSPQRPAAIVGNDLTDSGLETTLVFHDGMELPHFASFDLLRTREGKKRILDYYRDHAQIAQRQASVSCWKR